MKNHFRNFLIHHPFLFFGKLCVKFLLFLPMYFKLLDTIEFNVNVFKL